ncbi:hypothetical protein BH24ACT23_BH24ACT23_05650 [soil metagenome]
MSEATETSLDAALKAVAEGATERDRAPRFPVEAVDALRRAGTLEPGAFASADGSPLEREWSVLRAVAAADGSVGRIYDGHLNALDRLGAALPDDQAQSLFTRVRDEELLLGVWGADPGPDEGEPARIVGNPAAALGNGGAETLRLDGVKTFCSGAGGVDLALVMARGQEPGPPWLVLVAPDQSAEVDRNWFRASGLRASESHRVVFHETPVVALLGGPGELGRDPWFSLDAMRTAAMWAGLVDAAADSAIEFLRERRAEEDLSRLAAGRIKAARATVDAWLGHAARTAAGDHAGLQGASVAMRAEIAAAGGRVLAEAAAACGSHPFATGGRLDRARRDLQLFVLQHRLDPLLTRTGGAVLG